MKNLIKKYTQALDTLGFDLYTEANYDKHLIHVERDRTNPLQISAITLEKIDNLKTRVGVKIDPKNDDHRRKYFDCYKASKFFTKLGDNSRIKCRTQTELFKSLTAKFNTEFKHSINLTVKLIDNENIPNFYSMEAGCLNNNGLRTFVTNGDTCMQDKPSSYFQVYRRTKGLRLAILADDSGNMYARALLWSNGSFLNHFAELTKAEQKNVTETEKEYYLDRVYIGGALYSDDDERATIQAMMYHELIELINKTDKTNIEYLHTYSASAINKVTTMHEKVNTIPDKNLIPRLEQGYTALEFDKFPYADTFKGLDGILWNTNEKGCDVALTETDGENGNDKRQCCDGCGTRYNADEEGGYSDADDMYLCDDCGTYCEERSEVIWSDEAVYNHYTGDYHHRQDLDVF
jgi:hypothetical protein